MIRIYPTKYRLYLKPLSKHKECDDEGVLLESHPLRPTPVWNIQTKMPIM
jgi:hypothetical protein